MGERRASFCRSRRRRISTYLCALLFLAAVYIICQGTSVFQLSNNTLEKKVKIHLEKEDSPQPVPKSSPTVRGVKTDELLYYAPGEDGLFHCIDGSDEVPMARVNDDYCDCPSDGSDEPGTDACPNAKFYCEYEDKFLPSGKVNDGICDCCDGSDEWKTELGSVKVKGLPLSDIIQHAPCLDTCSKVAGRQAEERRVRQLGQRLKQQYIDRARGQVSGDLFGKQGEFYPLSMECYDFADFSAVYKVCPFQKVEQTQKGHVFRVGRAGQWDPGHTDRRVLVMGEGDKRGCPNGPRRAQIEFRCGLTNRVARLREEDKCIYAIDFMTPAAC